MNDKTYKGIRFIVGMAAIFVLLAHATSCYGPTSRNPMDAARTPEESTSTADLSVTVFEPPIEESPAPTEQPTPSPTPSPAPTEQPTPSTAPTEQPIIEQEVQIDESVIQTHEDDTIILTVTDVSDYMTNYDLLKRKIVQEAGNQGMQGMMAVAQVIYDRAYLSCHDWNQDAGLYGVLTQRNQFASPYMGDLSPFEPTVSEAMEAVFIQGERIFDEVTTYFYNPQTSSEAGIEFMQAQKYVGTIGDHEFRTGWDEND